MDESSQASQVRPGIGRSIGTLLGRSFLPLLALGILLGTFVYGPWGALVLALVAWQLAGRVW